MSVGKGRITIVVRSKLLLNAFQHFRVLAAKEVALSSRIIKDALNLGKNKHGRKIWPNKAGCLVHADLYLSIGHATPISPTLFAIFRNIIMFLWLDLKRLSTQSTPSNGKHCASNPKWNDSEGRNQLLRTTLTQCLIISSLLMEDLQSNVVAKGWKKLRQNRKKGIIETLIEKNLEKK